MAREFKRVCKKIVCDMCNNVSEEKDVILDCFKTYEFNFVDYDGNVQGYATEEIDLCLVCQAKIHTIIKDTAQSNI